MIFFIGIVLVMKCLHTGLSEFAMTMKVVAQEQRLQILCMLSKVDRLCVCEIIQRLGIKQNLVSHHLKVLRDLGFVSSTQEWKSVYYSLNHEKIDQFKMLFSDIFTL